MGSDDTQEKRFAAWLADHGAIPRKLSRVYAVGASDGADLHQEMLVQLWRSLRTFAGQAQATTWIYRVCLNTALSWRRDQRRREERLPRSDVDLERTASSAAGPADSQEREERRAALLDAVRELPPTERSLIALSLEGLGHREIGEVLGMTANHVGVALLRVRRKLALQLKGFSDEL
jgi:RNA polymerase sigma-70 factor (ECF subfamily)